MTLPRPRTREEGTHTPCLVGVVICLCNGNVSLALIIGDWINASMSKIFKQKSLFKNILHCRMCQLTIQPFSSAAVVWVPLVVREWVSVFLYSSISLILVSRHLSLSLWPGSSYRHLCLGVSIQTNLITYPAPLLPHTQSLLVLARFNYLRSMN